METISQATREGLNAALNEAKIIGLDFNELRQAVYVTFWPIAINADGKIPADNRVLFAFSQSKSHRVFNDTRA